MQETISLTLEWKKLSNVTSLSLSFVISFEQNQEFYCFQLKNRKERLLGAGKGGCHFTTSGEVRDCFTTSLLWARGGKSNFPNSLQDIWPKVSLTSVQQCSGTPAWESNTRSFAAAFHLFHPLHPLPPLFWTAGGKCCCSLAVTGTHTTATSVPTKPTLR